ncbi:MAG: hypothetical protein EOP10_19290 [Proteobacteria bacterium]|nr:MAG: hypothetical protein EOP10_19290 [Pseudomonadota bacterium]
MPRLGLLNMAIGFTILFFAACAGAFVSFDLTEAYLRDTTQLHTWRTMLLSSAHGHTNLFGMLHIALGLTLPYSPLSPKIKAWQSAGLFAGVIAMGPLLMVRSAWGPSESLEGIGLVIGALLSLSLLTLASHSSALIYRFVKAA